MFCSKLPMPEGKLTIDVVQFSQEACTNYVEGFNSKPFSSKDNSLLDYVNLENLALLRKFDVSCSRITFLPIMVGSGSI